MPDNKFTEEEQKFAEEHIKADYELCFSNHVRFTNGELIDTQTPNDMPHKPEAQFMSYFCMNCGSDLDNLKKHVQECIKRKE